MCVCKSSCVLCLLLQVVRNIGLYYPFIFVLSRKTLQKFSILLNVFPMSPVDVTAPFWVEKVLKTANFPNSRKARFFLSDGKRGASASRFARFRRKQPPDGPDAHAALDFRKAGNFHPAELVTTCHRYVTAPFWVEKVRKNGQVPDFPKDFVLHTIFVFCPSTACRGPRS